MALGKTGILGRERLRRVRGRYPELIQALEDLDITDVDQDSEDDLPRLLESVLKEVRLYQ